MYEYHCKVVDVYDGDTLTLQVDLGFRVMHEIKVRLLDIDTPEVTGQERPEGLEAKMHVLKWLDHWTSLQPENQDWPFIVETSKTGKYGRWLADLRPASEAAMGSLHPASSLDIRSLVGSLKMSGHDTGDWRNW